MGLFEWDEKFSVGVSSIDEQHKKLVAYLNELHDGMMKGKGLDVLAPILDGLVSYTEEHFRFEEKYFYTTDYSHKDAHIEEHRVLVVKVTNYKNKIGRAEATLSSELLQFLKDWLMKHILGTDMKYKEHFLSRGIS